MCWGTRVGIINNKTWKEIFVGGALIKAMLHPKTKSSIKPVTSSLVSFFFTAVVLIIIIHLARVLVHFTALLHNPLTLPLLLAPLHAYLPLLTTFSPILSHNPPSILHANSLSLIYPPSASFTLIALPPFHPIFYSTCHSHS